MNIQPITNEERNRRDEAFREALRNVPRFAGIETLEPVALLLRQTWVKFHPHMAAVFTLTGRYSI